MELEVRAFAIFEYYCRESELEEEDGSEDNPEEDQKVGAYNAYTRL